MLDFNHTTKLTNRAVPDLEIGALALSRVQERRDYLGGSRLGEACARKLQYEYRGQPSGRALSARTMMIFATGHALEAEVAKLLKASGLDIRIADRNGQQFGFATAEGRIRGHIDGVICGGPPELGPFPYLWENKGVGSKYWQAIVKKGVAAERPVYAAQMAIYMAYMNLTANPALFSVVNRDSGEIAFERYPFDAKLAQAASDRGVQVLQATDAGETLPRGFASEDSFGCRFCDFRGVCWRLADEARAG